MSVENIFIKVIFILFMGVCTIFDIRKKEVPLILIIIGMISALGINLWQIINGRIYIADMVISILIGLLFILISYFTKEKIGYGDGLILIVSGLVLGFYQCFWGLCISLIFSAAFALILLLMHKAEKNSGLPFIPFLTIGMGVSLFV